MVYLRSLRSDISLAKKQKHLENCMFPNFGFKAFMNVYGKKTENCRF